LKGRILVIDDEAEIRRNLSIGLMQEDFAVVACPDGISAIHELRQAKVQGSDFDYLITDIFMPDIDGLKILKVIKSLHPELPVLVITGFGDEKLKYTALAEYNTAWLDKPFEIGDLVRALESLSPGSTDTEGATEASGGTGRQVRESVSAYLTIRITDETRSQDIFDRLNVMEGVQSCNATHGDVDIILLAQASSPEGIQRLFEKVKGMEGIEVASMSPVEIPKLDRDVKEFVDVYQQAAKQKTRAELGKHTGTMSYIFVDIDRNAIQQVFTTVFFIDEVVFCDVIENGARLVGMITGLDTGEQIRKTIDRLARVDGVLRVREAKIIRMTDG
jgi:two-component system cell cycle response regulator CpdR